MRVSFSDSSSTAARVAPLIHAGHVAGQRRIIAIAGPPAAGKSTFVDALQDALEKRLLASAIVPMDGFHLDNSLLKTRDRLPFKGAPDTFDAAGFTALIQRIKSEPHVFTPRFDRVRDLSVACSAEVLPKHEIILVEGNYLLLDDPAWEPLQPLWDFTIFLDVGLPELERRLIGRWKNYGLSSEDAKERALANDIPNARTVINGSLREVDIHVAR